MNWLSREDIAKAAGISDLAALKCVREHWAQIRDAGIIELLAALDRGDVSFTEKFCAVCLRAQLFQADYKCNSQKVPEVSCRSPEKFIN